MNNKTIANYSLFQKDLKQDIEILELQQKNIQHLGKEKFISIKIDLIRAHIEALLYGNTKKMQQTTTVLL